MTDKNKFLPSWDIYSLGIIFLFLFFQILRWRLFPLFLDIYYHLSVMLGFNTAGGYVLKSFWEMAPLGRPHLYPPLLHILMLLFYKLGFSKIFIARFFNFAVFPLMLFVVWLVVKKIFSSRLAFFVVLVFSSAFTIYLSLINTLAASLALICGLASFACLEKNRTVAATIWLTFAFYLHALIPWIMVSTFIIYVIFNRKNFRGYLKTIFLSAIFASPILIHEYLNRTHFSFVYLSENLQIVYALPIYLLAGLGAVFCLRKKGSYYFFIALTIGFLALAWHYPFRYFCGEGMIGYIFLAAVALDGLYTKALNFKKSLLVLISFIVLFFIFSPAIGISKGKFQLTIFNSTLIHLLPEFNKDQAANEVSLLHPAFYSEITKTIQENSSPDDIIYANFRYFSGVLGVLAERATSGAMLEEVKADYKFDPLQAAKLVIWLKDPEKLNEEPRVLIDKYRLKKIEDTALAWVYKNPAASARRMVAKPVIPNAVIFVLFFLSLALIGIDLTRQRPRF